MQKIPIKVHPQNPAAFAVLHHRKRKARRKMISPRFVNLLSADITAERIDALKEAAPEALLRRQLTTHRFLVDIVSR